MIPTFPSVKERWFECWICGFDFPLSQARRHYRSNRLVDARCDDEQTQTDYFQDWVLPTQAEADRRVTPEQPVTCQGEVTGTRWYQGEWYRGKWYDPGDKDCSGGK